jgi:uncharacterized membrane protein
MQNKARFTREQKYLLALFGILAMSSIISVGLFAARTAPSPNGPYTSLVLNLFLAWTPLGFAWMVYKFAHISKIPVRILVILSAILWLIFIPNSFYILTDFQHIAIMDTDTPVWYDVIMLLWFSGSGLWLGLLSLYLMQRVISQWFGKILSWVFAVGAITLNSLGIYVGRFMYKNSWDLALNPFIFPKYILVFILQNQKEAVAFSLPFALLLLFVYLVFFVFGQLISEHRNQE